MKEYEGKKEGELAEQPSFGAAAFKVVCEPTEVRLEIHDGQVVARANKDVYEELFEFCVQKLGGRIDTEGKQGLQDKRHRIAQI
jgi:hypothetical protein